MLSARSELRYLKGVGPRRAEGLIAAGVGSVEDLLYQLCIEVNPNLDIHEVRLCPEQAPAKVDEAQPATRAVSNIKLRTFI